MTSKPKVNRSLLGVALILLCFLGSGCETLVNSAFDTWDYNSRVDWYKDRGMSQKKAERNAYEDQFFDRR
jgi:hypothetical protein